MTTARPRSIHYPQLKEKLTHYQGRAISLPGLKRAAVATILHPVKSGGAEVLFIKRSEHPQDPWSGHMAFPGGRVDPTDIDEFAAVYREVQEEIGLDLENEGTYLTRLNDIRAMARGKLMPMVITPFVFTVSSLPQLHLNEEVVEVVWVPLPFFYAKSSKSTVPYQIKGITIPLPCYRYNERVIWGLTYRMLQNLLRAI